MSWRTNAIVFPVKVVKNPNVKGVFYIHDDEDDEICVLYGQTEATCQLILNAINAAAPKIEPAALAASE